MSLAFASETDLGWHPTIKSSLDLSGKRLYKIAVNEIEYTANAILADFSTDSPLGRATRVWRVKGPDGKLCVLKDIWVDEGRPLEYDVYNKILEDVLDKRGEVDCKTPRETNRALQGQCW